MNMKKVATMGTILLTGLSLTACVSSSNESSSSSKKESTSKVAKSNSKKEASSKKESSSSSKKSNDANDILQSMDSKKLAKFNEDLSSSLSEDQGFANDGQKGYDYATYIDTLAYDHNRGLIVTVNDDFMGLNGAQKTTVGQGAQKLAATQLVIDGMDIGADSSAIMTNVHYGSERVGHSKSFSPSNFKWK
ncbi:hypothetical protein FIV11_14180 [Lactiplantibacillus plantarum]|uniref:hypothetical protein n=1 Tax=Lactiplantibacillus plantarum TaxID=1590 RepID=UPI00264B0854|nr:hypothetical protein [Lactiplantibacillus plantarum]MDN7062856.1 hypothetical protein [Lactiplantibacillus plantarum]